MSRENLKAEALYVLNNIFGYKKYKDGQEEILETILDNKNILAIMPTGAGKSLCYQIPAIISEKKTVIISPLIALIDDQVLSLLQYGIIAEKLHSNLTDEDISTSWNNFKNNKTNIIYISPERLMNNFILDSLMSMDIGLFVIDEIHCVSKWGQSFRPDYEELSKLKLLFPNSKIAGFTATADKTTRLDIQEKIYQEDVEVFVKGFDRPNLSLSISQKINWKSQLLDFLNIRKGQSGIIYCLSRKKTEEVSSFLNKHGFHTNAYHAGIDGNIRSDIQNIFMTEKTNIVVATIAFGMGIDKPDIRFVVHLDLPASMEAYYQEIGRAGRDGNPADTFLIYGLNDLYIRRKMIEESKLNKEQKLNEHKRLDYLLSYCESPECRRKTLLSYFDDFSDNCNNCDNCLTQPKLIDGTVLAQKLLSTIFRTGQFFGQAHVINVLRGSEDKKVIEKGHNYLSVYGIGKNKSKEFWRSFLRQLLAFGHLQINFQKFGAIQITKTGLKILKENEKFFFQDIPDQIDIKNTKKTKIVFDEFSTNQDLLNELKLLRLNLAKKQNIPAYAVFHDTTLIQMSKILPKNEYEFLKIDGVGPVKFKKYGDLFLKVINTDFKTKF